MGARRAWTVSMISVLSMPCRYGVRVAELVWREASPYAGLASDAAQLRPGGAGCPQPSASAR
jgi:hypothetical protein